MKPLFPVEISKRRFLQLLILYCCVLFYVVFLTPNRYDGDLYVPNLKLMVATLERIHKPAGEHFWMYYTMYWGNILGNIFLFVPFGVLLMGAGSSSNAKQIIIYGLLTSIGIELLQLILQIGVCDIDDVILNTVGTTLGVFLYRKMLIVYYDDLLTNS